jgi:Tfp pilus assembly protein, pilus retraction ATPase PilT
MDPMEHITQLDELNFSDLYIRIDMRSPSRYRIGPNPEGLLGNFRVPQEYEGQIDIIRTQIEKSQTSEGTITHDSMRLRYSTAHVVNDQKWAAIRRIPLDVPFLDDLDMLPEALNVIRGWSRRRGVVLIGGSTGAGKTTTASSILQDFLYGTGGTAVAIEDPPEYLLQGEVGDAGACYQIEVRDDDWSSAVKTALRWRPRYIFIGEIRTPEAANQALRASTSGHLVLATIHGGSVEETVNALLSLNTAANNMRETGRSLLADNLVGVIHQRLGVHGPDLDILSVPSGRNSGELRQLLRDNRLSRLQEYTTAYLAKRPPVRPARA